MLVHYFWKKYLASCSHFFLLNDSTPFHCHAGRKCLTTYQQFLQRITNHVSIITLFPSGKPVAILARRGNGEIRSRAMTIRPERTHPTVTYMIMIPLCLYLLLCFQPACLRQHQPFHFQHHFLLHRCLPCFHLLRRHRNLLRNVNERAALLRRRHHHHHSYHGATFLRACWMIHSRYTLFSCDTLSNTELM